MSLISDIFTWWNGTTLSTRLYTQRHGQFVGEDSFGNKYYTEKHAGKKAAKTHKRGNAETGSSTKPARLRRWVIYNGVAEASKVPPEWFGWLHYMLDEPPTHSEPIKTWQKPHIANMTGTPQAWRPAGSILNAHRRRMGTPDYEPWRAE